MLASPTDDSSACGCPRGARRAARSPRCRPVEGRWVPAGCAWDTSTSSLCHDPAPHVPVLRDSDPVTGDTYGLGPLVEVEAHAARSSHAA